MDLVVVLFLTVVSAGIFLYAAALPQGGWRWWALALPIVGLVLAGELSGEGWLSIALFAAAELLAVALVFSAGGKARIAGKRYLLAVLPALICSAAGYALISSGVAPDSASGKAAVALVAIGFALKLALVPFYFWLPSVAEDAPPMTAAIVISVVDIASFGELMRLAGTAPWIVSDHSGLWLALALLSMLGGALLALAQTDLKRMLAFSTIDDMGYLLVGLVAAGDSGLSGAWLGVLSHSLCKVILFGAVGVAERGTGKAITLDTKALAHRFPAASAAFIAGALGFLGLPPALGFTGRWRLYTAGAGLGWPILAVMVASSILALLYYVRAIHRVWLGPAEEGATPSKAKVHGIGMASGVLIALVVAMIALGIYPDGWLDAEGPFTLLISGLGW
jgi:multicomponent Na+:H+ antiporter subunit D